MARDYLSVDDLTPDELDHVMRLATELKADRSLHATSLAGRTIALIFEKASTRTRVSFEVGVEPARRESAHAVVLRSPAGAR